MTAISSRTSSPLPGEPTIFEYPDAFRQLSASIDRSCLVMDPRIDFVTSFIRNNYQRRLTLAEMASTVNLSRWRFCHLFKECTGTSPEKFVIQVRLAKAKELLETEFLTVKEVMNQVGMSDASFFARSFRTAYGITPGRYRNIHGVRAIETMKPPFEDHRAGHF